MDEIQFLAVETIQKGKQAIVFVPSRASAEKTAEDIAKLVDAHHPELEAEVLKAVSTPTKQCKRLSKIILKGVAFHHAGLLQKQKDLIEEEFKQGKIKIICCTPTLCLSGDTEIWHPDGTTLAKNSFSSKSLFVLSQNNKLKMMKAKNVIKNKNLMKLIEISNVSGNSIKLTPNHKILIKRDGKKELIQAFQCKKGDKIATVGKLNINQILKPKISDFVKDNIFPINDCELTKEDFYFIGSMLGDGHSGAETKDGKIRYKGSPSFTSGDLESIELIELISKHFDPFSKRRKRLGSIGLVLTKKKWFREFLCRTGVNIGIQKFINPILLQADLEFLKNLIQGLFDTDGCVQKNRNIAFSNISITLIKNLQRALLRFGIVSRVRKRKGRSINITGIEYWAKDIYELVIDHNMCIFLFYKHIGFRLKRKQEALGQLVQERLHILFFECKECNYKVYSDLFLGRTKEQKVWGLKKRKVIELLGTKSELGSREIEKELGFLPRHSKGNRLNHHYELIKKIRIGSKSKTEWFWSLNLIGSWIYWKIIKENKSLSEFFNLAVCPICNNSLDKKLRKKWRDSDFDGDIFWDYIRNVQEVGVEKEVYDIVLPNKPENNHMFVANGFIVHNSAGLSLPVFRVIIKSLKRFSGRWGMDWIPVLEYLQMAGRAGRPEYEAYGESIVIAKDEAHKTEIYEKYVCGVPEDIYSKLAVEPVLRTYLLSLISSGIIKDEETMNQFFAKTFWAHQYKDMDKLEMIMDKMLDLLNGWTFVNVIDHTEQKDDFQVASSIGKKTNKLMRPTLIGKRVSELYLDPLTASHLIECLQAYNYEKEVFSLLQMVSHTLEMRPLLRLKVKDDFVQEELTQRFDQLLKKEPSVFDLDYEEFLHSIKTTLFFEDWIHEKDEDFLMEKYGIRPGEIRMKLESADWLLYAASELAKILDYKDAIKDIHKLRIRVKNGVKEELLPLLKLKGVGRMRARKMYTNGLKDLGDLKKIDATSLSQILGKAVSLNIKEQLGEDVIVVPSGTRKGQLSLEKF